MDEEILLSIRDSVAQTIERIRYAVSMPFAIASFCHIFSFFEFFVFVLSLKVNPFEIGKRVINFFGGEIVQ
jgi:hypothetical protein